MSSLIKEPFVGDDHKQRRLDHVFCLYEGKPRMISTRHMSLNDLKPDEVYLVPHNMYGYETARDSPDRTRINYVNNKDLNIFDIPSGYVNYGSSSLCTVRVPSRSTQVGICQWNIADINQTQGRSTVIKALFSKGFHDMVLGNFETPNTVWSLVREGKRHAMAMNRDFAVSTVENGLYSLHYRGVMLGISTYLDPKFTVLESRKKLVKVMEEEIHSFNFTLM